MLTSVRERAALIDNNHPEQTIKFLGERYGNEEKCETALALYDSSMDSSVPSTDITGIVLSTLVRV